MKKFVAHCKKEPYDVYIGRPSVWGNPFTIGRDGSRTEVIDMFRDYLLNSPELMKQLPNLKGKVLGCWCYPKACHGDVLAELANQPIQSKTGKQTITQQQKRNMGRKTLRRTLEQQIIDHNDSMFLVKHGLSIDKIIDRKYPGNLSVQIKKMIIKWDAKIKKTIAVSN